MQLPQLPLSSYLTSDSIIRLLFFARRSFCIYIYHMLGNYCLVCDIAFFFFLFNLEEEEEKDKSAGM